MKVIPAYTMSPTMRIADISNTNRIFLLAGSDGDAIIMVSRFFFSI